MTYAEKKAAGIITLKQLSPKGQPKVFEMSVKTFDPQTGEPKLGTPLPIQKSDIEKSIEILTEKLEFNKSLLAEFE